MNDDDDKLSPEDSTLIRSLTRNHKVASNSIPRIMGLLRGHISHEDLGRLAATMGRGTTPEDRYTAVMAIVGPLLAPEEGEESMREAFAQMMSWPDGIGINDGST